MNASHVDWELRRYIMSDVSTEYKSQSSARTIMFLSTKLSLQPQDHD